MKRRLILVTLASAIFGGMLANAKPAAAWWTRSYGGTLSPYEYYSRMYATKAEYPVVSTTATPVADAVVIKVETYNIRSDAQPTLEICAAHWGGSSETCSPTQSQTGSGYKSYDFSADEAVWNNASNFPYVVVIAWNAAGAWSETIRVNGIVVSD